MGSTLTRVLACAAFVAQAGVTTATAQHGPFRHRSHLESRFRDDGNAACTKCHEFNQPGTADYLAPYGKCDGCHQPGLLSTHDGKPAARPIESGANDKDVIPFDHSSTKHQTIDCLQCHAPVETDEPSDVKFEVHHDLSQCVSCHSDHSETSPKNASLLRFLRTRKNQCSICHRTEASDAARPRNNRQFFHFDHLSHGGSGQPTTEWTVKGCEECHAPILEPGPINRDNYAKKFLGPDSDSSCTKCHKGAKETDVPLRWMQVTRTDGPRIRRVTLTTFDHSRHIRTTKMNLSECTKCHPESARGEPQTDASYEYCVSCHTDQKVPHHGESSGCERCHEGTVDPAPSFENPRIALVEVSRERPPPFVLDAHAHPGVTLAGPALPTDENCGKCHVGTPEKLLRTTPRPFDHAKHLPAQPTTADCLNCHRNVVTTADNQFTEIYSDPAPGTGRSCEECHKGSSFPSSATPAQSMKVPQFSHRSHMSSKKRTLKCSDCHADPKRPGSIVTPDPTSCTNCHNHNAGKRKYPNLPDFSDITGDLDAGSSMNHCNFCHVPSGGSYSSSNLDFPEFRPSAWLEPGHQLHDKSEGCRNCHDLKTDHLGDVVEHLPALDVKSPHQQPSLAHEWFNVSTKNDGSDCRKCHTSDAVRLYLRNRAKR